MTRLEVVIADLEALVVVPQQREVGAAAVDVAHAFEHWRGGQELGQPALQHWKRQQRRVDWLRYQEHTAVATAVEGK